MRQGGLSQAELKMNDARIAFGLLCDAGAFDQYDRDNAMPDKVYGSLSGS